MKAHDMTLLTFSSGRVAAAFLFAQFALIQATLAILGAAINWPDSLRDPAAIVLPRLATHESAVLLGYGCYLTAVFMLIPATLALNKRLQVTGGMANLMMTLVSLSVVFKAIGIGRWLFVMPTLAQAYNFPSGDKIAVGLLYDAINAFAGGIGEVLGVGLAGGLWTLGLAWALIQAPAKFSKILGVFALIGGVALLASMAPHFIHSLSGSLLMTSNVIWQLALLAVGVWAFLNPRVA